MQPGNVSVITFEETADSSAVFLNGRTTDEKVRGVKTPYFFLLILYLFKKKYLKISLVTA